jgi:hypothetical protein
VKHPGVVGGSYLGTACCLAGAALANVFLAGCTAESVRIAIEAQQRADAVQQAVFERQSDALRILLYRDLLRKLGEAGVALNAQQRGVVSDIWNDRDLLEFWQIQQERARALRMIGVDSRLYSEQSIVDLMIRSISAKLDRLGEQAAARAGARVRPEGDTEPNEGGRP